jgi:hypothetical protein
MATPLERDVQVLEDGTASGPVDTRRGSAPLPLPGFAPDEAAALMCHCACAGSVAPPLGEWPSARDAARPLVVTPAPVVGDVETSDELASCATRRDLARRRGRPHPSAPFVRGDPTVAPSGAPPGTRCAEGAAPSRRSARGTCGVISTASAQRDERRARSRSLAPLRDPPGLGPVVTAAPHVGSDCVERGWPRLLRHL